MTVEYLFLMLYLSSFFGRVNFFLMYIKGKMVSVLEEDLEGYEFSKVRCDVKYLSIRGEWTTDLNGDI